MKWGIARLLGLASFAAAAALFGAGSIRAQQDGAAPEEGEPWALSLAAQLHAEKRCDVQATYFVRELPSAEERSTRAAFVASMGASSIFLNPSRISSSI